MTIPVRVEKWSTKKKTSSITKTWKWTPLKMEEKMAPIPTKAAMMKMALATINRWKVTKKPKMVMALLSARSPDMPRRSRA